MSTSASSTKRALAIILLVSIFVTVSYLLDDAYLRLLTTSQKGVNSTLSPTNSILSTNKTNLQNAFSQLDLKNQNRKPNLNDLNLKRSQDEHFDKQSTSSSHLPSERNDVDQDININQQNCSHPIAASFQLQPLPSTAPDFLKTYAVWHAKQRQCLMDASCKKKPKVLVSRCPPIGECLGVGDRIRGIFFSFWLAVVTNRVFFIDWSSDPYPLQVSMIPASIDWSLPPNLPLNISWPYMNWRFICYGSDECGSEFPEEADTYTYDGRRINLATDNVEKVLGDTQILAIFNRLRPALVRWIASNPHYASKYGKYTKTLPIIQKNRAFIIPALFQPSEETKKKMASIAFSNNQPYMALHIRAGTGVFESIDDRFLDYTIRGEEITKNMVRCLSILRNATDGPRRVFLAADSEDVKGIARNLLNADGYEVTEFNNTAIHFDKLPRLDGPTERKKKFLCDSFLGVYGDLFMMAGAEYILTSGSHFSVFAEMLNEHVKLLLYHKDRKEDLNLSCMPNRATVGG